MTPDIIPSSHQISASTTLELAEHGGHLGFVSGSWSHPIFWLEERLPEYLKEQLIIKKINE
jgi:predicted alpha/beta-fold hydrolase